MRLGKKLLTACVLLCPTFAAADFVPWIEFKGTQLFRDRAGGAYCYSTAHSRVDADGAPNAYHPDDVGKHCMRDPHKGLDCPANAGFPGTNWWRSVLVPDPADESRPYIQPNGPTKGFFVAKTWLTNGAAANSASNYVDSTKVPYIVFPGSAFSRMDGTGSKGDLGIAWHENGRRTSFVVADQGGGSNARLGEASIAFYERLGGRNLNARTGSGVAPGTVKFLVFPGSRRNFAWPQTVEAMDRKADELLSSIGGETAIGSCR
ncbi:glycoside hydrolase family 75 protein [Aliirhizobium terrae]|uniref:glycoside hydrolase family 75 protein n=1 Tax=Terrirhizobium terrae TaxID=2926709 RepID=UPI002576DEEF|nr:glycoside hydrolase family 75 protein [Rhizobium sp. CC-CFT758]WJH39541.1 glycoside hydrolase family 75 protein [Rhizobium sp. CC-CFT758]